MLATYPFSYAIVRVVPHVEREEFVNAGVIVFCDALSFLGARIELDLSRLLAMAPDAEVPLLRRHLDAIPRISFGGDSGGAIGLMPIRERWQWLLAPRSTMLQTSPAHAGLCKEPKEELERLMAQVVRAPKVVRSA